MAHKIVCSSTLNENRTGQDQNQAYASVQAQNSGVNSAPAVCAQPVPFAVAVPVYSQPGTFYQQDLERGTRLTAMQNNQGLFRFNHPIPAQAVVIVPRTGKPPNHIGLALFACLCCIAPIGLCALCLACRVDSFWQSGNYAAAVQASRLALQLSLASILTGMVLILIGALTKEN